MKDSLKNHWQRASLPWTIIALLAGAGCHGEMAFEIQDRPDAHADAFFPAHDAQGGGHLPPGTGTDVTSPDARPGPDVPGPDASPPADSGPDVPGPADNADPGPSCGNGVIDDGETCDPPGSCPTSCDDANACTVGALLGSAETCDAHCAFEPITACVNGDGCCPAGCTITNDDDCSFDCRDAEGWPANWRDFETEVVRLFNEHRAAGADCRSAGTFAAAPALTMHALVQQAARCHSVDQWEGGFMSHTGSDGSTLGQRLTREGYSWRAAAENVARGQTTPAAVVTAWMNSDGHCRNIMNSNYQHVGIGFVNRSWTAKFGRQ